MSSIIRATAPKTAINNGRADLAVLPNGMFRGQLEGLLTDVSNHIGMSGALLTTLLTMIRSTRPSDWENPSKEPVYTRMQTDLATQLCKTGRAVRLDEWALEHKFGFIKKHVSANGSRRSNGEDYRQGIIFTPLIEQVDALVALRDRMQREVTEKQTLKLECSALRRKIKAVLKELQPLYPDDPELCSVHNSFTSWPRRFSVFKSLDDYESHYEDVKETEGRADKIRERLLMSNNTSARGEINFLPYIQDTKEDTNVICNASVEKRTDGNPPDANLFRAAPDGSAECLEKKHEDANVECNSKFLENLKPKVLFSLCSMEMQFYITHHQGERTAPNAMDFIQASINRRPELGISRPAYTVALEQMGDLATALCILIIDRNRFHPKIPIHNPGGCLRAMTERHKVSKLNLIGSLKGLTERDKG